jgi:Fe-S cluster assembly protein SufD
MKTNPSSSLANTASFLTQYADNEKLFSSGIKDLKQKAISRFETLGFPTAKNEEWKYTNVAGLLGNKFDVSTDEFHLGKNDVQQFISEEANSIFLVFENGKLNKKLSQLSALPAGVLAGSIYEYQDHPALKTNLGKIAQFSDEGFAALNTAMFHDGAFVYAEKNIVFDKTIQLVFINDARRSTVVSYPRNLIVAEPGSSIRINESYFSVKSINPAFCNPVSEVLIDENAAVEYCKIQSENENDFHIDYTFATLKKDSNFNIHTITTGGKITRNNLRIALQDKNANAYLNGLYVLSGESHVDNHTVVDHASPHCYSNELYKGVLDDKSQGIFNGKILVRKDAQKTNAFQSNKNILISDNASMNAKPQLEIFADDVKCSHGATTGQLDQEALFYLRSRGIGKELSQALLTIAFAGEVLDKITDEPVREKLREFIHSKLLKSRD